MDDLVDDGTTAEAGTRASTSIPLMDNIVANLSTLVADTAHASRMEP